MDKHKIESICRKSGMVPVSRDRIDGTEVFIADGFNAHPGIAFKRFGVDPGDFPGGCYATLWWISRKEDELDVGQPLFFKLLHNPELTSEGKKRARINAAKAEARTFIAAWQRKKAMH